MFNQILSIISIILFIFSAYFRVYILINTIRKFYKYARLVIFVAYIILSIIFYFYEDKDKNKENVLNQITISILLTSLAIDLGSPYSIS